MSGLVITRNFVSSMLDNSELEVRTHYAVTTGLRIQHCTQKMMSGTTVCIMHTAVCIGSYGISVFSTPFPTLNRIPFVHTLAGLLTKSKIYSNIYVVVVYHVGGMIDVD